MDSRKPLYPSPKSTPNRLLSDSYFDSELSGHLSEIDLDGSEVSMEEYSQASSIETQIGDLSDPFTIDDENGFTLAASDSSTESSLSDTESYTALSSESSSDEEDSSFTTSDATTESNSSDSESYVALSSGLSSDDDAYIAIPVISEGALLWNNVMCDRAESLLELADQRYDKGLYAEAENFYNEAISLIDSIPERERLVRMYRLLDRGYNNLATCYHKLGEYENEKQAYLSAYTTLSCVRDNVAEQDDLYWMADYSLSIAFVSMKLGEPAEEYKIYLENAVNILAGGHNAVPLRNKDKLLLARCHLELNHFVAVLNVLDTISDKNDDYYTLSAKCKEKIALAIDPIDRPVSTHSVASARLLLESLHDLYKVAHRSDRVEGALARVNAALNEKLEDICQYVCEQDQPSVAIETTVVSMSRVTLFGRQQATSAGLYQQSDVTENAVPRPSF